MFPIFDTAPALIWELSSGDTPHSLAAVIGASLGQLSADILPFCGDLRRMDFLYSAKTHLLNTLNRQIRKFIPMSYM